MFVCLLAGLHKIQWNGGSCRLTWPLFTTSITIHTPLVLDCPHSKRTLRTPMRKLLTLVSKCLLPQHPHHSPLRPASPRLLRRAIPRQSLACPGDTTSSPGLQLLAPAVTVGVLTLAVSCDSCTHRLDCYDRYDIANVHTHWRVGR